MFTGDKLDHYRIEKLTARSGMASIYQAVDERDGKIVGIKIPHSEMECDPVLFERFQREEEIGTKLDHPAIMKVYRDEDRSKVYMVMEWVEGRLLREILRESRRLEPERAIRFTLAILDALDYIHSHGVVHRDLKPENIMVNGNDVIKLIDFGIAAKEGARRITFAKFSQLLGTPDYVSPEQVKGKSGDARSDLYAAGVMLYEMLTGEVPFKGANPLLIMNDRLINNPVPPTTLNPEITPQLQEVIYRAMERDPRQRYARASEFAWDLKNLDQVGVGEREELINWKRRKAPILGRVLLWVGLAAIPFIVFGLLFLVATHG
jgi:serine/threonine-protein kinase